jgi:hypothetical protein
MMFEIMCIIFESCLNHIDAYCATSTSV